MEPTVFTGLWATLTLNWFKGLPSMKMSHSKTPITLKIPSYLKLIYLIYINDLQNHQQKLCILIGNLKINVTISLYLDQPSGGSRPVYKEGAINLGKARKLFGPLLGLNRLCSATFEQLLEF